MLHSGVGVPKFGPGAGPALVRGKSQVVVFINVAEDILFVLSSCQLIIIDLVRNTNIG